MLFSWLSKRVAIAKLSKIRRIMELCGKHELEHYFYWNRCQVPFALLHIAIVSDIVQDVQMVHLTIFKIL